MIEQILDPISKDDVIAAYDFAIQVPKNEIVKTLNLGSKVVSISERNGPPPCVQYRFNVFGSSTGDVLDNDAERHLIPQGILFKKKNSSEEALGKVAANEWLFIKKDFQRRGIASLLYEIEERLYRKWGAVQIQLCATNAGRTVWRKMGFIVPIGELYDLERRYERWCNETNKVYIEKMNIRDYPEEFLLSDAVHQITMFKELN
jgi:GNAT superfamily N-acetyltransferase